MDYIYIRAEKHGGGIKFLRDFPANVSLARTQAEQEFEPGGRLYRLVSESTVPESASDEDETSGEHVQKVIDVICAMDA